MVKLVQSTSQRQTHSLALIQKQILISSLLQLPMLQLEQRIETELVENPILEESEQMEDLQTDNMEIESDREESEEIQEEFEKIEGKL